MSRCSRSPMGSRLSDFGRGRPHLHGSAGSVRAGYCPLGERSDEGQGLELDSIAAIHSELVRMLDRHRLPAHFNGIPSEIENAVPFAADTVRRDDDPRFRRSPSPSIRSHASSVRALPCRFHRQVESGAAMVGRVRSRRQPLHRAKGAAAPRGMPGLPDRITREAYSHEVASGGFWAGGATAAEPFFYAYIYPAQTGYRAGGAAPAWALRRHFWRIRAARL